MKAIQGIRYDNGDDSHTRVIFIRASRKDKAKLRTFRQRSRWSDTVYTGVYAGLIDAGQLEPLGCNCSHCAAGWDCCGNMFPAFHKVTFRRRYIVIETEFQRNV